MIARTWRGATAASDADRYVDYLRATGVLEYVRTPGNRGLLMLRRVEEDRTEFLLLTLWDSMDAVRAFSGPDERRAVFYPEDDAFLVDRDEHADHFEVVLAHGMLAAS